ncbi:MAG: sugar transferase [Lachnospiraceae bacterium]|nr:sugar transferase [Lachnospiraceae bacterium]
MISYDARRRLYTLLTCFIMIAADVSLVLYVLNGTYNPGFRTQLYLRGHIFVMSFYTVVFIFLGNVFGGMLVGMRKNGEVMFSMLFTLLFSNTFFYLIVAMLSYKFPTVIPVLVISAIQLVFSFIWIAITGSLYQRIFKPYDVLLIYKGDSISTFKQKLSTRRDQFHVASSISTEVGEEKLQNEIKKYNTVMLWDIPAQQRNRIFKFCYENSKRIYSMPKISDIILNGSKAVHLFDTPLLLTEGNPLEYEERVIKRAFDILMSLILIIVTSPIMLLTALAIKIYDGGPVLYKQIRCTKNCREFKIIKFRSMIVNAEQAGVQLATKKDPRITPVGGVIRACRIDELPQLFNVIKGDMSFVGPRPERPEFIEKYLKTMPEFSYRMKVRAGITGYAQLYGKYNTRPYDKLKFDLYYIEQYSLWLDIKLIILTFKILFTRESTEGVSESEIIAGGDREKI